MNPTKDFRSSAKPIRYTVVCVTLAAALALPAQSQAGWLDQVKQAAHARAHATTTKVAAAPGNARDRIQDITDKVNEIYSTIEEHRPLADKIRNSRMMDTVKETLTFVQDMQSGYQEFAANGVYTFRSDMKTLVTDFTTIGQSLGRNGSALQRLQKVDSLIDKMPTSFLFVMHKAVGSALNELHTRATAIGQRMGTLSALPRMRKLYQHPNYYASQVCGLVNDKGTVITVAALQTQLRSLSFTIKSIKDLLPSDLVVDADVVAGGGATVSKNPQPIPFQLMLTIVDGINLKIENYKTMATAICGP